DQAEKLETDKGAWLLHKALVKGASVVSLLPEVVAQALAMLPIAKPMRWVSSDTVFIRPVQTVVMLYGNDVVPATILGRNSGNQTHGHRFHAPAKLTINNADHYLTALRQAYVVADFAERKAFIAEGVEKVAAEHKGKVQVD